MYLLINYLFNFMSNSVYIVVWTVTVVFFSSFLGCNGEFTYLSNLSFCCSFFMAALSLWILLLCN